MVGYGERPVAAGGCFAGPSAIASSGGSAEAIAACRVCQQDQGPSGLGGPGARALFDLSPDVREAAIRALKDRPCEEYRQLLLDGLRYPWAPAADHAAEALVALDDRESVLPMAEMLAEPDPTLPLSRAFHEVDRGLIFTPRFAKELPLSLVAFDEHQGSQRRTALLSDPNDGRLQAEIPVGEVAVVREVVRVNHLRNCLLCHPPSVATTDIVRGLVPSPSEALDSPSDVYNQRKPNGIFVRAEVTYLRQDFSIPQPVANPGKWPAHQRYDYVVRTRYATDAERQRIAPQTYPQREAVRWAIRELSGAKGG